MDEDITYGELLHLLTTEAKEIFRTVEKTKRRLIARKYSGLFNNCCLNEELLPNYSNITR